MPTRTNLHRTRNTSCKARSWHKRERTVASHNHLRDMASWTYMKGCTARPPPLSQQYPASFKFCQSISVVIPISSPRTPQSRTPSYFFFLALPCPLTTLFQPAKELFDGSLHHLPSSVHAIHHRRIGIDTAVCPSTHHLLLITIHP